MIIGLNHFLKATKIMYLLIGESVRMISGISDGQIHDIIFIYICVER